MIDNDAPLIYLPASWLYYLAFNPKRILSAEIAESLKINGWLEKYPAKMTLNRGTFPRIDGQHRLSFLARTGRLDWQVPCLLFLNK